MIAHLTGLLFKKAAESVIIHAGGIGYEVFVPLSTFYTLPGQEEKVSLHIHTYVREDAIILFGFHTKLEKNIFIMLISVSGIGPKLALNILSGIGPLDLLEAIARGDANRLQAIPGVGKKTSERIALELKDRALKVLGREQVSRPPPEVEDRRLVDDALSALLNLGYSAKPAKSAVEKARSAVEELTLEGLIRDALRILA
ncbi:MAG: Holliday junction branch migration protein RuvA [Thermodesulfobacteriota bacterium]|nr:Holliday junction branch migration protein RuvA [Thermodesulfobacteriota bacterium]